MMMTNSQVQAFTRDCPLVVVDMDGTCLDSRSMLSEATRRTLREIALRGIIVVPASGRGLWNVQNELLRLSEIRYFITGNGSMLTDAQTEECMRRRLIDRELALRVIETFMSSDTVVYVHEDDWESTHLWGCDRPEDAFEIAHCETRQREFAPSLEADLVETVRTGTPFVHKVGVMFRTPLTFESVENIVAEQFPELVCFRVNSYSVEITDSEASKALALAYLCKRLDLSLDEVCAIGDNGNDVGMLDEVGLGVAMLNAPATVQAAADYVTEFDNDQDGAARFLQEYFLD